MLIAAIVRHSLCLFIRLLVPESKMDAMAI